MKKTTIIKRIASVFLAVVVLIATCQLPVLTRIAHADQPGGGDCFTSDGEVTFQAGYWNGDPYPTTFVVTMDNGRVVCNHQNGFGGNASDDLGSPSDVKKLMVGESAHVFIECDLPNIQTLSLENASSIEIDQGATMTLSTDYTISNDGTITNNGTLTANGTTISPNGRIVNNGTFGRMEGVNVCDVTINGTFTNNGSVVADYLMLEGGATVIDSTDSIWKADSSFRKSTSGNLSGTVVAADEFTTISNTAGSFTLELDGAQTLVNGYVNLSTTAGGLIPQVEIVKKAGYGGPYLAGTNYDPRTKLEYKLNGSTISIPASDVSLVYYVNGSGNPDAILSSTDDFDQGTLYPMITVAGTETYRGATFYGIDSQIEVDPMDWDNASDYVTVTKTDGNPGWYLSDVVYTAKSGYQVRTNSNAFSQKTTHAIWHNDEDGQDYVNSDCGIQVKRLSDGAITTYKYDSFFGVDYAAAFDKNAPTLTADLEDGSTIETSDGMQMTAKKVVFQATDLNMNTLTLEGPEGTRTYNRSVFNKANSSAPYVYAFPVYVTPGTYNYKITATDEAGNVLRRTISITYARDNATSALYVRPAEGYDTIVSGTAWKPELSSNSDGAADAVYTYKKKDASDDTFITDPPTAAGDYVVRATIPETKKFKKTVCEASFTLVRAQTTASVTLDGALSGTDYTPTLTTNSDANPVYMYKPAGAPDSAYSTDAPKGAGTYCLHVHLPQTDSCEATSCDTEFTLTNLGVPEQGYAINGTKGNADYYTSDVWIAAPEGYLISDTYGDGYKEAIEYREGLGKVYYKRAEDGAWTGGVDFTETLKIDKVAPIVASSKDQSGASVVLGANTLVYADELTVTLSDDHLASVRLDGKDMTVADGKCTLELTPGKRQTTYSIVAEDDAGNTYTAKVIVVGTWVNKRDVPVGVKISLEAGESLVFGNGKWMVSGDSTIYEGSQRFYVAKSGDYTFEAAE